MLVIRGMDDEFLLFSAITSVALTAVGAFFSLTGDESDAGVFPFLLFSSPICIPFVSSFSLQKNKK